MKYIRRAQLLSNPRGLAAIFILIIISYCVEHVDAVLLVKNVFARCNADFPLLASPQKFNACATNASRLFRQRGQRCAFLEQKLARVECLKQVENSAILGAISKTRIDIMHRD